MPMDALASTCSRAGWVSVLAIGTATGRSATTRPEGSHHVRLDPHARRAQVVVIDDLDVAAGLRGGARCEAIARGS